MLGAQPSGEAVDEELRDLDQLFFRQRAEDDDLVDAVDELRSEVLPKDVHQILLQPLERFVRPRLLLNAVRTQVRGHDHDRVLEVDGAPLRVGEAAVVENLEQDVEDVWMRLLDLVEQQHRIGPPPHLLRQLSRFLVADVTGRRADEPRDRMALLELAHVEADHEVLAAEERLGQRARELGLADAGRTEEQEAADRLARVAEAGA